MWLDRAVKWLLPREEHFFDLLERGADCAVGTASLLAQCCEAHSLSERETIVSRISDAEHAADRVIHDVYDALNKTFVTPLDRSDIYALASSLEGIVDTINATSMQITMHAMEDVPGGSVDLAHKVEKACKEIDSAVKLLRGMKRLDEIRDHCRAVYQLEHDGDQVFRASIVQIFKNQKDAVSLIKHKEFLEGLENTLDVCDNVANALDALVIKNA
jgi:uncharacterized protein